MDFFFKRFNEALSSKDFVYRIKICRKESKESRFFLRLIDLEKTENLEEERDWSIQEATELMNIFGAIIRNHKKEENTITGILQ